MFQKLSKNFIARVTIFVDGETEEQDQELAMKIRFTDTTFAGAQAELLHVLGHDIRRGSAKILSLKHEVPAKSLDY